MKRKLEKLMQEKGITQYRLSKETGIPQSSISAWMNDICKPKADKLMILAEYFGVHIDYFLSVTQKEEQKRNRKEDD